MNRPPLCSNVMFAPLSAIGESSRKLSKLVFSWLGGVPSTRCAFFAAHACLVICATSAHANCLDGAAAAVARFQGNIEIEYSPQNGGLLYYRSDKVTCVLEKNAEYEDVLKEYPLTALFEEEISDVSDTLAGNWLDGAFDAHRHHSEIEIDGRSQIGLVIFGTSWYSDEAGSISTGDFLGFDTVTEGSGIRTLLKGEQNPDCFLDIEKIGKFLVVLDSDNNNRCGGQRVSFTGIYGKRD